MAKWTQQDDEQYLLQFLPRFVEKRGAARVKNVDKKAFLLEVLEAYQNNFPGRIDTMKFTDIDFGGTKEERETRLRKVRLAAPIE